MQVSRGEKQTSYSGEPDYALFLCSKLMVIIKLYNWFTSFKLKNNLYTRVSDGLQECVYIFFFLTVKIDLNVMLTSFGDQDKKKKNNKQKTNGGVKRPQTAEINIHSHVKVYAQSVMKNFFL